MTVNRVNVADIMRDIELGLGDVPIMEKYHITPGEYMNVLERLKNVGQFQKSDLATRLITLRTGGIKEDARETPRCYLVIGVLVSDSKNPNHQGKVVDLTENGCQVVGLACGAGEARRFRIRVEGFRGEVFQTEFLAECRWARRRQDDATPMAGFEIKEISRKDRQRLHDIIALIALCDQ
jgi:hypothetical protein